MDSSNLQLPAQAVQALEHGRLIQAIKILREDHAIYMTGFGRVNLAGLKREDVEPLLSALAQVPH